jgi:sugar lactone lactonase YvrE
LWVLDNGNGQVLHVNPANGNVYNVLASGFPDAARLNALTFDSAGNGYVTDSGLGRIYLIPSNAPDVSWTIWSDERRLKALNLWTQGPCPALVPGMITVPPTCRSSTANLLPSVGANGIEFIPPRCNPTTPPGCNSVLVANTANRNIVQIVLNGNPNPIGANTLVNGINGPDGIAIDGSGNIWVAANQSDEVVVLAPPPTPRVDRQAGRLRRYQFGG